MRAAAVIVLVALGSVACGGSEPPAQTPSSDTSSLESSSGSSKDAPADSASPASSSASDMPAAAPSTPPPAASDTASTPPAAFHPTPSATGAIDGKSFAPKMALVLSPIKKDGRVLVSLTEDTDCPAPGAKSDSAALTFLVPWQDGYKIDLAALKLGKKGHGEIAFSRGKKDVSATFKPSGTVTVLSAPTDKGSTGKLKIDMQSGDYMLAGTLDVELCVSPK